MEMASFSGLLRTLLWIVFIYYALKFLMRLLAPYLFQEIVKKAGQNFQQQQQQYQNQQQSQQNEQQPSNFEKPKEQKKVGEYIDFEEIE